MQYLYIYNYSFFSFFCQFLFVCNCKPTGILMSQIYINEHVVRVIFLVDLFFLAKSENGSDKDKPNQ